MRLMMIYLSVYLLLPLAGCYFLFFDNESVFGYRVTKEILYKYTAHVLIVLFLVIFIVKGKSGKLQIDFSRAYTLTILKRIRFFLWLSFFMIFYVSAYPIFFKGLDRGTVRSQLGLLGPLYTFVTQYLLVSSLILSGVLFFLTKNKFNVKRYVYYNFLIAFLASLITGYKATVITLMIPGLAFLFYNKSFVKFIPHAIIGIGLLIFTTMKVRNLPIDVAWYFLKYRVFKLTNFGTLAVYYELGKGASFSEFFFQFLSIFGKKIGALITGLSQNSPEFLKMQLSDYISYKVYPDKKSVLAGRVNLTVANFGEAIFFFGKKYFYFFSIFTGLVIGLVIKKIKMAMNVCNYKRVTFYGTIFFSIIIPWINSSGVYTLFSMPTIVYMTLNYMFIFSLTAKYKFNA